MSETEKSMSVGEEISWIQWFCGERGHEFFCQVNEEYISDKFNLFGLKTEKYQHYDIALDMILDYEIENQVAEYATKNKNAIEQETETLYGEIHARFILTTAGINLMKDKYLQKEFGTCPRVYCEKQAMLPIGLSDNVGESTVKCYCPKCKDVYEPKSTRFNTVDGAFFGTAFPHMFFLVNPELRPLPPTKGFEPRLYGFRVHPRAYQLQEKEAHEYNKTIFSIPAKHKASWGK